MGGVYLLLLVASDGEIERERRWEQALFMVMVAGKESRWAFIRNATGTKGREARWRGGGEERERGRREEKTRGGR